jgi:soluble lytic murein transglycosylase
MIYTGTRSILLESTMPRSLGFVVCVFSFLSWAQPPLTSELFSAPGLPEVSIAEWSSYFVSGPLAEAKALHDSGKFAKALALLEKEEQSPAVRFLVALCKAKLDLHQAAAEAFVALSSDYPPMRNWCLVHAGWSFEAAKKWEQAEAVYAQIDHDSDVFIDAAIGLSHVYKRTKRFVEARKILTPLLEGTASVAGRNPMADALWALADVEAQSGNASAQQKLLLSLYSRFPSSPLASQVEERLPNLYGLLSVDARLTRAEGLVDMHQNAVGLQQLQAIEQSLPPKSQLRCRLQLAKGKAQRKLRQHAAAKVTLSAVARLCKDEELLPKALSLLGYSQSLTSPREALQTYLRLATEFPQHGLADDALFAAGEMAERNKQWPEAAEYFSRLVNEFPGSDLAGEALFHLQQLFANAGDGDAALALLAEAEQRFESLPDSYELERAQYSRARLLLERKQTEAAAALFEQLATAHPTSYYGLFARQRLAEVSPERFEAFQRQMASEPPPATALRLPLAELQGDKRFLTAVELARLGMSDWLVSAVNAFDRSTLSEPALRVLSALLSSAGEARAAHQLARQWLKRPLSGPVDAESALVFTVAYPVVFRDLVEAHSAEAAGLDPDLLQALMREESALDARVLSWAGAYGLCQLMPATAAGLARKLSMKRPTREQLFDPSLNIKLGATYLSLLLKRYNGQAPYAIAAYNAGELAVDRWRKARPDQPLDLWIENIPLQETRGYVKRVLRSFNTYKLLYSHAFAQTQQPLRLGTEPKVAAPKKH